MAAFEKIGAPAESGGPTILVVDDVDLVRALIAESLRVRGFQTLEAGSGEEAIRLLTNGLAVQVVLTDMYMPAAELDGLGLARWIRDHRPDIKVVVGSGVSFSVDPADAHLFAGPVVAKPYDWNALEQRLRAVADQMMD
jgi:CheY-like chemotaxis protein